MFIGSSSIGPVISVDLCKCLKASNLKRELSLPGSAGICGWVWLALRLCVDFRAKNKKRGKKSSPSAHLSPSVPQDTCMSCVLDNSIRVVPQPLTMGRCGGNLLPLSCPFLMIPASRLEQAPWPPKAAFMLGHCFSPSYSPSLWHKINRNYLDCKGFLHMYLILVRAVLWLCFWVQVLRMVGFQWGWLFSLPASLSSLLSNEIAHSVLGLQSKLSAID